MQRIMIVEDDAKLGMLIKSHLEKYGYNPYLVEDFSDILVEFKNVSPEIILMDVNLPYFDGYYWCRKIRETSKVPIIFVSARDSDMDQVMAIEYGGDDYITKPFSYDVLIAKIKGIYRRVYGSYSGNSSEVYEVSGLSVYMDQNIVKFKDKSIELSKNEFLLLCSLLKNINKIVSRDTLLEILWNDIDFVDDNTLSVNITRLRKRLSELNIEDAIETKRGQGYILRDSWKDGGR